MLLKKQIETEWEFSYFCFAEAWKQEAIFYSRTHMRKFQNGYDRGHISYPDHITSTYEGGGDRKMEG